MSSSVVLPLGPEGMERVGFVFTFDPLFSATILRAAGDGDPETLAQRHARILQQIPHEIRLTFNGTPVKIEPPPDVEVTTAAGRVTYRFAVLLPAPLRPPGTLDITVDDPGLLAAYAPHVFEPVEVQTSGAFTASCERASTTRGAPGTDPLPLRRRTLVGRRPGRLADVVPAQPKIPDVGARDQEAAGDRDDPFARLAEHVVAGDRGRAQHREAQEPEADDAPVLVPSASQRKADGTGGKNESQKEAMKDVIGESEGPQDRRRQDNEQRSDQAMRDAHARHGEGDLVEPLRRQRSSRLDPSGSVSVPTVTGPVRPSSR
jgi:hypothetical protein